MARSISEQRRQLDRRQQAMTPPGTLRWHGRRQACRRSSEAYHAYLDGLAPRIVLLVVFVLTCSALDALFTLLHLQQGGSEANPVMALVIEQGTTTFVGLKMVLTGFGATVLAVYQQCWLGLRGLHGLSLVYAGLLVYHTIIFFSGV